MLEKALIIYTSIDDPNAKLKTETQILLTLTPFNQSELFKKYEPIAWKVITFPPQSDKQEFLKVQMSHGFSVITDCSNIIQPGISTTVQLRQEVFLQRIAGNPMWEGSRLLNVAGRVAARNASGVSQQLALCCVDASNDKYEPLVHLGTILDGKVVQISAPVMLQAYSVVGYEEGQLLSVGDRKNFLLASWKKEPEPVNISGAGKCVVFHLYTDNKTGKVVLKNQS